MSDKLKKLSQAIRLGSTFRPQCFGAMFVEDEHTGQVHSCALGAAAESTLGVNPSPKSRLEECEISIALSKRFQLPEGTYNQVMDWNDKTKLTREQIALALECQGL